MLPRYTKEQYLELFEKLPDELQDAIFSTETADNILNACMTYGIGDEKLSQIATLVGDVLLGVLPLESFKTTLRTEVSLEEVIAKGISQQINRFIFYPVKPALEQLYKMEITSTGEPAGRKEEMPAEEKPAAPAGKDTYREPIE